MSIGEAHKKKIEKLLNTIGCNTPKKQQDWLNTKDSILGLWAEERLGTSCDISAQELINIGSHDVVIDYLTDMIEEMEDNGDL